MQEFPNGGPQHTPASRRKPAGQMLFDTVDTVLTLIIHVSNHCIYNKYDLEHDIPLKDALLFSPRRCAYFIMC